MKATRRSFIKKSIAGGALSHIPMLGKTALGQSNSLPFILTIHCKGGYDPTMVFDPKAGIAGIAQEPGAATLTSASGIKFTHHPDRPAVQDFFDLYGANCCIVNGITTKSMTHEQALLSSSTSLDPDTGLQTDILLQYSARIASYKQIPHLAIESSCLMGFKGNNAIQIDMNEVSNIQNYSTTNMALDSTSNQLITSYLQGNFQTLLNSSTQAGVDGQKSSALYYNHTRSSNLKEVFDAITYKDTDSNFLKSAILALECFKRDKTQSAAITHDGPNSIGWDSHENHFARQSTNFEDLFSELTEILAYADTLGIRSNLHIVIKSDVGRAPYLNSLSGKDHWAFTSGMIISEKFKGGQTLHTTDALLKAAIIDPLVGRSLPDTSVYLSWNHIYAALLLISGMAPETIWPGIRPAVFLLKELG